jgi:cell shape-determining protein MreC
LVQQQQQIDQLAGFRQVKAWEGMGFLRADAVTRSDPHHLVVNCGTADGLTKGHLVMADNAIIGTITELGTHTAKVELVTSPLSRLRVTVLPSNVQGILCGRGDGFTKIQVRPPSAAAVGEKVFVKIPGLRDATVVVGTVVRCGVDDQEPVLWGIEVQPACDLNRVATVWVINPRSP